MLYVIQVETGKESETVFLCKKYMDPECYKEMFIPRYECKKRYKGEWHVQERNLFPGYIFVQPLSEEEREDPISWVRDELAKVPRMTKLICHEDTPVPIYPHEEKFIRSVVDKDYTIRMSEGLILGDELVILNGALKDYRGMIKKIDRHRRLAWIDVDVFGRPTPVEIGLEVAKKVSTEEFEAWKKALWGDGEDKTEVKEKKVEEEKGQEEETEKVQKTPKSSPSHKKSRSGSSEHLTFNMESLLEGLHLGAEIPPGNVLIKSGVFSGMRGELVSEKNGRYKVLLNVFGDMSNVEFEEDEIMILNNGK
ncbi:MAG: antiterminator LoaP [Eubacterium sp.]|nr:antiterminator LoaP [Eubacterium sp.]